VQTAMDISDGLVADLGHICKASRTGAIIQTASLPIRKEVISLFAADAAEMALSGGEDYQLLFTAKAEIMEKVVQDSKYPVTVIGRILEEDPGRVVLEDREGRRYQPQKTGWDHFKRR
jgi:thiamine-monophosphate kinase